MPFAKRLTIRAGKMDMKQPCMVKYKMECDHEFIEWRGRSICVECGVLENEI